jgi:hypothetical protein
MMAAMMIKRQTTANTIPEISMAWSSALFVLLVPLSPLTACGSEPLCAAEEHVPLTQILDEQSLGVQHGDPFAEVSQYPFAPGLMQIPLRQFVWLVQGSKGFVLHSPGKTQH